MWKHEAYDFTKWLEENMDALNAALNLNLVNVDREQQAGAFSIDLVAEDDGGGTTSSSKISSTRVVTTILPADHLLDGQ